MERERSGGDGRSVSLREEAGPEGESKMAGERVSEKGYRVRELSLREGGRFIYGQAYLPADGGEGPYPTVILSHGFGVDHHALADFAELLARDGIASYAFDFRGGGVGCRSSGTLLEMTVRTELEDLEFVLARVRGMEFVEKSRLYLCGESQGGFVSAWCGARHASQVTGLILLYPAFMIPDYCVEHFPDEREIPETVTTLGTEVSGDYYRVAREIDIYGEIAGFRGKVIIFHGDRDELVPMSYSERAVRTLADARLVVVPGAVHGFYNEEVPQVEAQIVDFLRE